MDLNLLTYRNVSFGNRTGHYTSLRCHAAKELKIRLDELAVSTDDVIQEMFVERGFLPVVINGHSGENETVFLIKKDDLEKAIKLTR